MRTHAGPTGALAGPRGATGPAGQRGEVSSWLLQLLIVVAIVGLVVYEAVALGLATVQIDDLAREVARDARDEYRAEQSIEAARDVADDAAAEGEATVVRLQTGDEALTVTLEKDARTLIVHRIGPLAERLTPSATRRVDLRP